MKDIIIRTLKTFLQGFLGVLIVTLPNSNLIDRTIIKSLLIGAVTVGISSL